MGKKNPDKNKCDLGLKGLAIHAILHHCLEVNIKIIFIRLICVLNKDFDFQLFFFLSLLTKAGRLTKSYYHTLPELHFSYQKVNSRLLTNTINLIFLHTYKHSVFLQTTIVHIYHSFGGFKYMRVTYQNYVPVRAHAIKLQVFNLLVMYPSPSRSLVNRD